MRTSSLLLGLCFLIGCRAPVGPQPGEDFTLRVGKSATIPTAGLRLTFVAVTGDSRCPEDVVCVWAGSAPIELRVQLPGRDTALLLDPTQGPQTGIVEGWRVALRALNPAPHTGRTIPASEYEATFRVSSNTATP
jgi:hypothetical protein